MAYFAALLARTEDGWEARETELDEMETLDDVAELAREASVDEETVLVLLEQEDVWFCIVRVDGEEDPRVFVSDGAAASRSSYGEVILADLLPDRDDDGLPDLDLVELEEGSADTADGEDDADDDADPSDGPAAEPLGDAELLTDFGITAKELTALGGEGSQPADAFGEITEALGCAEVLEAVR